MADGADCKEGFGKPQVSPANQVEADLKVASPSTGPEILAKKRELEISLFGLSRKLLLLDALVRQKVDAFSGQDGERNSSGAQGPNSAVNLLHECVLELISISKLEDSPLPEITSEILGQYGSLYPVQVLDDRPRPRGKYVPCSLSKREQEVVKHLAEGRCNKEIASALGLSVKTVETYRARVLIKLNAHSLNDVFRFALRNGILEF
jgi:DNA-binding CsgD family transcriptional regulator